MDEMGNDFLSSLLSPRQEFPACCISLLFDKIVNSQKYKYLKFLNFINIIIRKLSFALLYYSSILFLLFYSFYDFF